MQECFGHEYYDIYYICLYVNDNNCHASHFLQCTISVIIYSII